MNADLKIVDITAYPTSFPVPCGSDFSYDDADGPAL